MSALPTPLDEPILKATNCPSSLSTGWEHGRLLEPSIALANAAALLLAQEVVPPTMSRTKISAWPDVGPTPVSPVANATYRPSAVITGVVEPVLLRPGG